MNTQSKFYVGSAMHHTLDWEYSRSRKYLQLNNERLVQAELALRYWQEHDNLYIWATLLGVVDQDPLPMGMLCCVVFEEDQQGL